MTGLHRLRFLFLLIAAVASEPTPGRVPKVYNALITSNQNLEPSKAYPVYQPVLHDAGFGFPFQSSVFYGGDFPLGNGLIPAPRPFPQDPNVLPKAPQPESAASTAAPEAAPSDSPAPEEPPNEQPSEQPSVQPSEQGSQAPTSAPPLPPNTQSPIPLNQFGLPSQVLPLGRFDPAFDGFTQVGFSYPYPGYRFYDPYDPFSLSPYANLPPLYRPLPNVLSYSPPVGPPKGPLPVPVGPAPAPTPTEQSASPSPPEPSDLNVLNYASKDPAIPNVPPPPLPSGGLRSDKSE